jgi:hypothetical protein
MIRKKLELCRGYWKGSYTVEAAIIVSITVFVLGALIISSFYLHDRAVLQGAACEAAAVGSIFATEEERSEAAASVRESVTVSRLLGSRNLSGYATTGTSQSISSWSADYPIPGFAARYLMGNQLHISTSWTCKILDPADTIRKIRGVASLLNGGDN